MVVNLRGGAPEALSKAGAEIGWTPEPDPVCDLGHSAGVPLQQFTSSFETDISDELDRRKVC